jgi:T5SS/PEP-CTERM-associated repeat protein
MAVALGLSAAALPSAFAQAHQFTADETVTNQRTYLQGFTVGPNGTVRVDVTGNGALTSLAGVSIGSAAGADGTLALDGPLARLGVTASNMVVGQSGKGTLVLSNGAQASLDSGLALGLAETGAGTVNVVGNGSLLTANTIDVGGQGNGTLNISANAQVTTTQLRVGVQSPSSGTTAGIVTVGSSGQLEVNGGAFILGDSNRGTLTVDNGGRVVVSGNLIMGSQSNGFGTLNVAAGGTLTLGNASTLVIGNAQDGVGEVTISGIGAVVNAPSVVVGLDGSGTLTVQNGGVLNASTSLTAEASGNNPNRISMIRVSGANARINAGHVEATAVLLDGGGSIVSNSALIRDAFGPVLPTTIQEAGSHWTNSGLMTIESSVDVVAGGSTDHRHAAGVRWHQF